MKRVIFTKGTYGSNNHSCFYIDYEIDGQLSTKNQFFFDDDEEISGFVRKYLYFGYEVVFKQMET